MVPKRAGYWGRLVEDPALPLAEAQQICERLVARDNTEELVRGDIETWGGDNSFVADVIEIEMA